MLNLSRSLCVRSALLSLLISAAPALHAQAASQHPGLDRQLDRLDLGVVAVGIFNKDSNGTAVVDAAPTSVDLHPGNTVGPVVTLRYTAKPLVGFEINYGYARYTQTFTPFGNPQSGPVGVQQNASEYTAGYVAHFVNHPLFGTTPFVSAGLGTTAFRPTPGGGESLINQARMTYYYSVGVEKVVFSPHFGFRAIYRQSFFLAPDFGQNYLTIKQHTSTYEPGFGFFLKF